VSAVPSELERDAARHGRRLRGILRSTRRVVACMSTLSGSATAGSQAPAPAVQRTATHEEIARRAFEIYCERSHQDGHDLADWLRAERECLQATASAPFRLRIKPDRRQYRQPPPGFDRRA